MRSAAPWLTFRWYRGQRHYAGTYWSATTQSHVIYESRLELARLLFSDFDSCVHGIVAQPFLLTAVVDSRVRKHVPNYFLTTERGLWSKELRDVRSVEEDPSIAGSRSIRRTVGRSTSRSHWPGRAVAVLGELRALDAEADATRVSHWASPAPGTIRPQACHSVTRAA
jgi:hypothetical protein